MKEKEIIMKWLLNHIESDSILNIDRDGEEDTFFEIYPNRKYIQEIDMSTPVKMKEALDEVLKGENDAELLVKACVVWSYKLRKADSKSADSIKSKIYNF